MHEHIKVSLLLGRITKGHLAGCFHLFLRVFEKSFLQKTFHLDGKEWPIKPG